jgi:hypothetical protein
VTRSGSQRARLILRLPLFSSESRFCKKELTVDNTLRRALREFLREFFGPFRTLITNLVGEDGEKWSRELNKFLRGEECWRMPNAEGGHPPTMEVPLKRLKVGECFIDRNSNSWIWMKVTTPEGYGIVPISGRGMGATHGIPDSDDVVDKILSPTRITIELHRHER